MGKWFIGAHPAANRFGEPNALNARVGRESNCAPKQFRGLQLDRACSASQKNKAEDQAATKLSHNERTKADWPLTRGAFFSGQFDCHTRARRGWRGVRRGQIRTGPHSPVLVQFEIHRDVEQLGMPTLIATTFSDQTNQPLVWLCSSCEAAVREGVEKLSASSSSGSRS